MGKCKKDRKFNEIKIKMVMRLRGVNRRSAIRLIRLGAAAAEQKRTERTSRSCSTAGTSEDRDLDDFFGV